MGTAALAVPAVLFTTATPALAASGDKISVVLDDSVVPPGGTTTARVTLTTSAGAAFAGASVTVTSSDGAVTVSSSALVTDASGTCSTIVTVSNSASKGTAAITATGRGVSSSAALQYQQSGQVIQTNPYSGDPFGSAVSADGSELYVSGQTGGSGNSYNVQILDTSSLSVTKTIQLSARTDNVRRSSDGTAMYAWGVGGTSVATIDIASKSLLRTVSYAAGLGSANIRSAAVTPNGATLYLTTGNDVFHADPADPNGTLTKVNSDTLNVVVALFAPPQADRLFAIEAPSKGTGSVVVITPSTGTVSRPIPLPTRAQVIGTMTSDGSRLYLAVATVVASPYSTKIEIWAVDTGAGGVLWKATIPTSRATASAIAVTEQGDRVILADSANLFSVKVSTQAVTKVGTAANVWGLSLSPDGTLAYVSEDAMVTPSQPAGVVAITL